MIQFRATRCPSGATGHVSEERLRTLGSSFFALLLQEAGEAAPAGASLGVVELVAESTVASKIVLLLLALMSVSSWAIILYKTWTFQRIQRQSASFLDVFRRSSKFSEVQAVCRSLKESPLVGLFQAGYAELTTQLRQTQPALEVVGGPAHGAAAGTARPTLKSLAAVDRALLRASTVELNKLEKRIPFLASTASVAPFIGLLGTVWGILIAFQEIGATGASDLAAVGAPIAEALIATAAGLFAAIPAAYFYNVLTLKVKLFASEMDDFSLEFLNIAERNFT